MHVNDKQRNISHKKKKKKYNSKDNYPLDSCD